MMKKSLMVLSTALVLSQSFGMLTPLAATSKSSVETESNYTSTLRGVVEAVKKTDVKGQTLIFMTSFTDKSYEIVFSGKEAPKVGEKVFFNVVDASNVTDSERYQGISYGKLSDVNDYQDGEVVTVYGKPEKLVRKSDGMNVYQVLVGKERLTVSFSKEILGAKYKSDVSNKFLEMVGVISIQENDSPLLTLANFRESGLSNEYEAAEKGTLVRKGEVTILQRTKRNEREDVYDVMTEQGNRFALTFSRVTLKKHFSEENLTGKTIQTTFSYKGALEKKGGKVLSYTLLKKNQFAKARVTLKNIVSETDSSIVVSVKDADGKRYEVVLSKEAWNRTSVNRLKGKTLYLEGQERTVGGKVYFDAYSLKNTPKPTFNSQDNDTVTFEGKVLKETASSNGVKAFLVKNPYGKTETLLFDEEYYGAKVEVGKDIVVTGYKVKGGILVTSKNDYRLPKDGPSKRKPLYQDPKSFPNLRGYHGVLDVLTVDTSHLMLITSSDQFLLSGEESVLKKVEANLRKKVYLRGEYRESAKPYWTGELKVYDFKVLGEGNTFVKPDMQPVLEPIGGPDKDAHETIQLPSEPPLKIHVGRGIIESKYQPIVLRGDTTIDLKNEHYKK